MLGQVIPLGGALLIAAVVPLAVVALVAPAQIVVGDWAARTVAENQPTKLAAFGLALRGHGWRIGYLGADTPAASLVGAARELAPDVRVNAVAPGPILWPDDEQFDEGEATLTIKLHMKLLSIVVALKGHPSLPVLKRINEK